MSLVLPATVKDGWSNYKTKDQQTPKHCFVSTFLVKSHRKHCWRYEETNIRTDWPCTGVKVQMFVTCLHLWYLLDSISTVTFPKNCFFCEAFKKSYWKILPKNIPVINDFINKNNIFMGNLLKCNHWIRRIKGIPAEEYKDFGNPHRDVYLCGVHPMFHSLGELIQWRNWG